MLDDLLDDELDETPDEEGCVIGIDLGTTNSVVGIVSGGRAIALSDPDSGNLVPSVIAFVPNGSRVVGGAARARRTIDPLNTVYSVKRIIGQSFRSPRVQEAIRGLPYQVVEGKQEEPLIVTRAGRHSVSEVSSYVLGHLRSLAEHHLGQRVTHCVVTVPANFSDGQRAATRRAAELAGMEVLRILNEPTAAALVYGRKRRLHQRLAVFDLGGGTFDMTVLAVRENVFEVIATGGDPFLGGDDFDEVIAQRLATQLLKEHRVDANADPAMRARLSMAAEQIKMRLSAEHSVDGVLRGIAYGEGGKPLSLKFHVARGEMEELIAPIVDKAIRKAQQVLTEARLTATQIDEVILVGGSTRVPLVQRRVAEAFGRTGKSDHDPMEVVGLGAALQANSLFAPSEESDVLMDVLSHSLGIGTAGGYTTTLIPKNTSVPAEGRRVFSTARDNQERVQIPVCQGEKSQFADNIEIGALSLEELPQGRRGEVRLEVAFYIDANGILQVTAKELSTGKDTKATLSAIGVNETR